MLLVTPPLRLLQALIFDEIKHNRQEFYVVVFLLKSGKILALSGVYICDDSDNKHVQHIVMF